jgi:hypothetical protein
MAMCFLANVMENLELMGWVENFYFKGPRTIITDKKTLMIPIC